MWLSERGGVLTELLATVLGYGYRVAGSHFQQPGSVQGPPRTRWPDLSVRESSTKENVKSGELHLIY